MGKRITRNAFWLITGDVVNRLLKLALLAVTTRTIAIADYGAFSFSLTLLAFTFVLADLGVSTVLQRRLSLVDDVRFFSTAFGLKLLLLVIAVVVSLTVSWVSYPSVAVLTMILLPMMVFDTLKNFFLVVAMAKNRMERVAIANNIETAVIVAVGFFTLYVYQSVAALAWAYVIGAIVAFVYVAITLRRHWWNIRTSLSSFDKELAAEIMWASWPLALGGLAWGLMNTTDSLFLGWLTSLDSVAYYNAASKIPQLLGPISGIITSATFPSLVATIGDQEKHKKLFARISEILFTMTLPLVAGGLVIAYPLITKVFGASYAPAAPILILLLLNVVQVNISFFLNQLIFIHNHQRKSLMYVVVAWVVNIVLCLALIPRYEMVGAAVASIIGQSIIFTSYVIFVRSQYQMHFFSRELVKPVVATVAMLFVLYVFDGSTRSIFFSIPMGAIVYGTVLFFLKPKMVTDLRMSMR